MALVKFDIYDESFPVPQPCGSICINPQYVASVQPYEYKGVRLALVQFSTGRQVIIGDACRQAELALSLTDGICK